MNGTGEQNAGGGLPVIEVEGITVEEVKEIRVIEERFLQAYKEKEETDTEGRWLLAQIRKELPETEEDKICSMAEEILQTVDGYDHNLRDLEKSCKEGKTKESWFAGKITEAAKGMTVTEFGNYLNGINQTLSNANAQMMRTITASSGNVSQCMNLDGFIAEQYAVNTFNANAKLNGSRFYAEVKVPGLGETYGKNSFDTVIMDSSTGKTVHQYQFKFGKDAKATIEMLKAGSYNNQRLVVPAEQVEEVRQAFPGKSVEAYMGGTEQVGVRSGTLTKEQAKQMQTDVQRDGSIPEHDWNAFNTKELALNVGKQAGIAGLEAAAISTGFMLAGKAVKGEEIPADEVIETALVTGADAGVKAATAGALHIGVQKGIITVIPKATPVSYITNIACVGIENIKILARVAKGEMTLAEGADNMAKTTIAMAYGLSWTACGMAMGAAAFSWLPVVGPVFGGIAGGLVAYMAGSKFGNFVYSGLKKVGSGIRSVATKAWNGVKSVGRGIRRAVGRVFGRR